MGVSTHVDAGVDRVERFQTSVVRYGPFVGSAVGVVITALVPFSITPDAGFWLLTGGLVLASAAWSYVFAFHLVSGEVVASRPGVGPLYVAGFVVLMAALVYRSPWFAFLAIPGYAHSYAFLRGRSRFVGMFAVALLHAYSTVGGGLVELTPLLVALVVPIALIIAAVSITMTNVTTLISEQSQRRGEIIDELHEANDRLSALQARLFAQAREAGTLDERARLAREIHDTIAQGLTGIVTQLEAAGVADGDAPVRRRHLDIASALARESLTEARRSVDALAPGRLVTAQLPDAISDMAKAWAQTAGVDVTVDTTGDPRPLVPDVEVTLFRVAQEALANVGKHAGAGRVGLTLSYMDDVVVLDVRDDGVGFDAAAVAGPSRGSGFGLAAMEQRVRRVSGTFTVESVPGEGAAVSAEVPAIPAEDGP
ncbi:MAG: sensor histidine kinase [Pseudonocardia sp.]|nr:sensor histidine kinase [Pseudonocardia sp.]